MTDILSGDWTVAEPRPGPEPEAGGPVEASGPGAGESGPSGRSRRLGLRLLPPRTPELAVGGWLSRSYRNILEALADAVHPMRAQHICAALGLSTDMSKVDGCRSKLKRLLAQVLIPVGLRPEP